MSEARPSPGQVAAPDQPPAAVPPPSGFGRWLGKRIALAAYRVVRPVVRPIVWRLRSFLTNSLAEQLQRVTEQLQRVTEQLQRVTEQLQHVSARVETFGAELPSAATEVRAEMRRMAPEIEHVLLTLTMEQQPNGTWPAAPASSIEPEYSASIAGSDAALVAAPAVAESTPATPFGGTLEELDALNAEYADRPVRERIRAVGEFLLSVKESPLDDAGDPFDSDYHDRVVRFWGQISRRAEYDPQRDELAPHLDLGSIVRSPSFYASGDSRHAGEFLVAIGAILQQLDIRSGESVIDYGAGEGQIALHLARLGCQVSAIDVEPRCLEAITRQASAIGAEISVQQGLFGDGFTDGRRFDRILFFEAFHHALEHARVLRQLHDRLKPGGFVVFAGEPVIVPGGPWTHVVPYPWGPRLDGLSINAMRLHGWCELGFREDYFVELLMRSGYTCTFHPCAATAIGNCYIARPHSGRINLGEPFLLQIVGHATGWHAPESDQRWTTDHAILPLDPIAARGGIRLDFYNFLPIGRTITVRLGNDEHTVEFDGGERREVGFEVPSDAIWLEILSPTDSLAPYTSGRDQRVVGIGVRAVTYVGWMRERSGQIALETDEPGLESSSDPVLSD